MNSREYLRVGQIVRAHGVRGAVKIDPTTDDPERFRALKEVFLEMHDGYRPVDVLSAKILNNGVVLQLQGYDSPEKAEMLRGIFVCVDRQHAVKLPAYSYFIADLIGSTVTDTDGNVYGKITDVYGTGANDVWEIDGGKLSVPALKSLIASFNAEARSIVFYADVLREVGLFED